MYIFFLETAKEYYTYMFETFKPCIGMY